MPDCPHDQLRHDFFQANPKNPEAPTFHTVRCQKCSQLVGIFPIERRLSFLESIYREITEIKKAVYAVEKAIPKK